MPAEFVGDDGASATLVTAATTPTSSNSGGQTAATSTPAKTNTPKTGKNPTATQPKSLGPKHISRTTAHRTTTAYRSHVADQPGFLTPVRAERGRRMPQLTRVRVFEEFFKKYPGKRDNRFGYGKAAVDFLGWEIASHRISRRGSAWWETVNGMMAEDLQTAMRDLKSHRRPQTKAVADWIAYAKAAQTGKGDAERLFWTAHQTSLHEGVAFASPHLPPPGSNEREFIQLALQLVDLAAVGDKPSDTRQVKSLISSGYPFKYPAPGDYVRSLFEFKILAQVSGELPKAGNIGLWSTRWHF